MAGPHLISTGLSALVSTASVRRLSPTANFSVPLYHSLTGVPSPLPVTSRSRVQNPLSGFAPKQTKESSAWRTTYIALHLTNKMNRSFFKAAVVSILRCGCTTWTLTKRMEKKLDSNYTRMLRTILNKSWRQQPTKQQLYGHLPPITKTIKIRRTRHVRHRWSSWDDLISDVHFVFTYLYGFKYLL